MIRASEQVRTVRILIAAGTGRGSMASKAMWEVDPETRSKVPSL